MKKYKKASVLSNECVACGCCVKSCPLSAISIYKGIYAVVNEAKCAGCQICEAACPAQVISVKEVEYVKA